MCLITIFAVLLILKLAGVVDWSSWIIFSPIILLCLLHMLYLISYLRSLAGKGRVIKAKRNRGFK